MGRNLQDLLGDKTVPDLLINGLAVDSRAVKPGYLFAALKGVKDDGARFIPDAIENGASVVLVEQGTELPGVDVPILHRFNARAALAHMAAKFFSAQPAKLVAVTGTNGKSSVVELFRQLAGLAGYNAASIGTLGVHHQGKTRPFGLTTPDPIKFHETLAELAHDNVTHAAFEASSHGLEQYRVDGVQIQAAAFTNLSRDHLDYHPSLEDYLFAKLRLFGEILPPQAVAVVNMDDRFAHEVETLAWVRGITTMGVGARGEDIHLLSRKAHGDGQQLKIGIQGQVYDVFLPLIGDFQASNVLVALGLLLACGERADSVVPLIKQLQGVPGRLEDIGCSRSGARVIIDYAHTPDGLRAALEAVAPHCSGRVHVVFGCGGDRDKGKRPEMGSIAAKFADRVYVTDDNPRSEDAAQIRADVLSEAPGAIEIGDREEAIAAAVSAAANGDLVLIAGKGHETGQIVGGKILPFSDILVAKAALETGEYIQ